MTHNIPRQSYILDREIIRKNFNFGKITLSLPRLILNTGKSIYILNILGGDPTLIRNLAIELIEKYNTELQYLDDADTIISVEGKAIHFAYEIAYQMHLPYVILRKSWKKYFLRPPLSSPVYQAITGSCTQSLYLDPKDWDLIYGKKLIYVDDVISTGATLNAAEQLIEQAEGKLISCMVLALEGDCSNVIQIPTCWLADLPIE